jgi:hypothetical protein
VFLEREVINISNDAFGKTRVSGLFPVQAKSEQPQQETEEK